eukprot:Transcript_18632.p1 GENE.Transcript_18632~~Transcript_18632.p1  ORF type:complete len:288 (+),score=72.63 Transcript_18632:67-930(+)
MLVASLSATGVSSPLQPEPLTGASGRADASQSGNPVGLRQTTSRATPEDMQNFVIFSRARSGTTWLIAMLNGHPELSCDGELLLGVKDDTGLRKFYQDFDRTGRLHTGIKGREQNKKTIKAQGFKWFHYQGGIHLFQPYYNWNIDNVTRAADTERAEEWARWLLKNQFKVVVFEREDRLARMVSEAKHNMMRDYVCTTEQCVEEHAKMKVRLKAEHLADKLKDDEEIGKKTMGWLSHHGFGGQQALRSLAPPHWHARLHRRGCVHILHRLWLACRAADRAVRSGCVW